MCACVHSREGSGRLVARVLGLAPQLSTRPRPAMGLTPIHTRLQAWRQYTFWRAARGACLRSTASAGEAGVRVPPSRSAGTRKQEQGVQIFICGAHFRAHMHTYAHPHAHIHTYTHTHTHTNTHTHTLTHSHTHTHTHTHTLCTQDAALRPLPPSAQPAPPTGKSKCAYAIIDMQLSQKKTDGFNVNKPRVSRRTLQVALTR